MSGDTAVHRRVTSHHRFLLKLHLAQIEVGSYFTASCRRKEVWTLVRQPFEART